MNICLIIPPAEFLINEKANAPIGIMYLSSYLKSKGHNVKIVHLTVNDNIEEEISKLKNYELFGITATTPQYKEALKVKEIIESKWPYKNIAIGGVHATVATNDCVNDEWGFVISGEGELAFEKLIENLENTKELNTVYSSEEFIDLSKLPLPDFEGINIQDYKFFIDGIPSTSIMLSRGCAFDCNFCSSKAMWKRKVRFFSFDYAKQMIDELHEKYGFKGFMLQDDVFPLNNLFFRQVTDYLHNKGLIYRCLVRADLLTESVAKQLKKTNCKGVGVGIESMNDRELELMNKNLTSKDNERCLKLCNKYNIPIKIFLMLGVPNQTKTSLKKTMLKLKKYDTEGCDVNILVPYKGTTFYEEMGKNGIKLVNEESIYTPTKGKPNTIKSCVETDWMSAKDIESMRNMLSNEFLKLYKHDLDVIKNEEK